MELTLTPTGTMVRLPRGEEARVWIGKWQGLTCMVFVVAAGIDQRATPEQTREFERAAGLEPVCSARMELGRDGAITPASKGAKPWPPPMGDPRCN